MSERPVIPRGYLGPQPKFTEFGLSTISHNNPEVTVDDNEFEIRIQKSQLTKVTVNLINAETLEYFNENVFIQTEGNVIYFHVCVPKAGYYKLQIYALPAADDSQTLPGVFNYLIHCTQACKPDYPFPKQYSPWTEGCYLYEPLVLCNTMQLNNVKFRVRIPGAQSVAVTADQEWQHLDKVEGDVWEGNISLEKYKGRDIRVSLNANFGGDSTKYATLLDYKLLTCNR